MIPISVLTPASAHGARELAALFTAVYEGYWFPIELDGAAFTAMVRQGDIDLEASRVALEGGTPAGIALLGIRGETGWIGGMGVVPALRRRGVGEGLMRAVLEAARARGLREVTLEVLEQNDSAIRLYERLGFERIRELEVWSAEAGGEPASGVRAATLDAAHVWIAAHRSDAEPWQRADAALPHARSLDPPPQALAVGDEKALRGAAIFRVNQGRAALIQIAAADTEAARDLLVGILDRADTLVWLNAPVGDPAAVALRALGGTVSARQLELVLRL